MSTTSNSTNKSLLKRRVIYSILAVCITLSKSSLATTETDLEEIRNDNNTGKTKYTDIKHLSNTRIFQSMCKIKCALIS